MARFLFKQSTMLRNGPAGVGGKHLIFAKGEHEVPDDAQKHPTFVHFAKGGLIVPVGAPEAPKELAPASGDIAKGQQAAKDAPPAPEEEIGGSDGEPVFPDDDEDKPAKGAKGKRK